MKRLFRKLAIAGELFHFLKTERLWWLMPPVIILILLGIIFVLSHGTVIAPFLYPLF